MTRMPVRLGAAFAITDCLLLLYWIVAALRQADIVDIPREWMYSGYDKAEVVAWNWSFLPLDISVSTLGLLSVAADGLGSMYWRPLALLSLAGTMVAGGMAVAYWIVLRQFDPAWFLPNLALFVWPLCFLPKLMRTLS